jgi:hypothetical protein
MWFSGLIIGVKTASVETWFLVVHLVGGEKWEKKSSERFAKGVCPVVASWFKGKMEE